MLGRGTPCYRPLEILLENGPGYTNKVDIWGVGCILYELAMGKMAFPSDLAVFYFQFGTRELSFEWDGSFSEQCKQSIKRNVGLMLTVEPSERPSATLLLEEFSRLFDITRLSDELTPISAGPPTLTNEPILTNMSLPSGGDDPESQIVEIDGKAPHGVPPSVPSSTSAGGAPMSPSVSGQYFSHLWTHVLAYKSMPQTERSFAWNDWSSFWNIDPESIGSFGKREVT